MNHMTLNASGLIDYAGDPGEPFEVVKYKGYWIEETNDRIIICLRGVILDRVDTIDEAKDWIDYDINLRKDEKDTSYNKR